jgi:threonine-phosphate decarboxylase
MSEHGGDIYRYNRPVVDFSSNINPLGVPERFKQALCENINVFANYPDPAYRNLKRQVAAYLRVEPEWVALGNGAVDLIYKAISAAGQKRVYGLSPSFSEYRRAAELPKLLYEEMSVFEGDYAGIDISQMLSRIKPDSLVVLCNPNNPTGTLVRREVLAEVSEALAGRNCFLIVDEAFMEFTDCCEAVTMMALVRRYPNLLVIRAATKFFGLPGLRLGYGVTTNQAWRERLRECGYERQERICIGGWLRFRI